MDVAALAGTIGGFVGIVAIGWLLRRAGILKREDARPINAIIIYVGLPALIFRAVHGAELGTDLAIIAGIAWAVFAITALLAWGIARLMRLERTVAGGFILAASLGNTGYIGYPLATAFLGEEGLVRAIFYDVFGTVGALLLVGLFVAERFGESGERNVNPIREALRFPAVLALGAALLMRGVTVPAVVGDGLDALATLVVPLIMISVGLSLRPGCVRCNGVPLAALTVIKLALAPALAAGLGALVLPDTDSLRLVVLEAGMPSMMLTLVIGARFKLDTGFIAAAILLTTILTIVSAPLAQLALG
jgi:hypothetical protein